METKIKCRNEIGDENLLLVIDNDDLNNNNYNYINITIESVYTDSIQGSVFISIDDLDSALEGFKKYRKNYDKLEKD